MMIIVYEDMMTLTWFVWSKTSYCGDVTDADGRTDGRTTSKDTATQLLICEKLSLANVYDVKSESLKFYFFRESSIFIGPRYTWGPIYGSECLSLSK